jgi:GNAT superfamily N-acetyltransferase
VGITTLERVPAPPDALRKRVHRRPARHRGRRIAKALKRAAIARARAWGYRALATEQHADNAAMLRVNEALGYRRVAARVRYEKGVD